MTVVAGVFWIWSRLTWWIIMPPVGELLLAHLLIPIFPKHWRDEASSFARVLIVVLVALFLLRFTSALAWGVAVGAGCMVRVFQLRAVLPPWAQWTAVGLSVALAVTCGLVAWLSWRVDQAEREAAERANHEYRVAEMRPDQPLGIFHLVVKAIHENNPMLVCFVFTPEGEREFAAAARAKNCPTATGASSARWCVIDGRPAGSSDQNLCTIYMRLHAAVRLESNRELIKD